MTLFSALRALPDLEVVGLNFSSATSPELILKTFDHYCEYRKTSNGLVLAPTQGHNQLENFSLRPNTIQRYPEANLRLYLDLKPHPCVLLRSLGNEYHKSSPAALQFWQTISLKFPPSNSPRACLDREVAGDVLRRDQPARHGRVRHAEGHLLPQAARRVQRVLPRHRPGMYFSFHGMSISGTPF